MASHFCSSRLRRCVPGNRGTEKSKTAAMVARNRTNMLLGAMPRTCEDRKLGVSRLSISSTSPLVDGSASEKHQCGSRSQPLMYVAARSPGNPLVLKSALPRQHNEFSAASGFPAQTLVGDHQR